MTTAEALAFLQLYQPLPSDEVLGQNTAIIDTYWAVIKHFTNHPDERCVPLLLNSFGKGDGLGVYQMVDDALLPLDPQIVMKALLHNLARSVELTQPVLYWNPNLCLAFANVEMQEYLAPLLFHTDIDVRMATIIALSGINNLESRHILLAHLTLESDSDVVALIHEVLEDMNDQGPK
jgi:hypothetical protein